MSANGWPSYVKYVAWLASSNSTSSNTPVSSAPISSASFSRMISFMSLPPLVAPEQHVQTAAEAPATLECFRHDVLRTLDDHLRGCPFGHHHHPVGTNI